MGKRKLQRTDRPKKKRFRGNRYTKSSAESQIVEHENEVVLDSESEECGVDVDKGLSEHTASTSKLGHGDFQHKKNEEEFDTDPGLTGFRFVDIELLINFVQSLLCPNCKRPIGGNKGLSRVSEHRSSLASKLDFHCQCQQKVSLNTSKECGRTYEVSRRFPLAMFSIGRHMKHGKKFLGSMNMHNTLNKESWYGHKKKITEATDGVATTSKLKAADEARQAQGRDITVSSDGTWQRKGFVSKNGVVTVLTVNGKECKVIDTHVLSNHCDARAKKKKRKRQMRNFNSGMLNIFANTSVNRTIMVLREPWNQPGQ